jgi:uncharacterized protein
MILETNRENLEQVRNPVMRAYLEQYLRIYERFMEQVRQTGVEVESVNEPRSGPAKMADLHLRGAILRNDARSLYTRRISEACLACQKGVGSATYFISLKCHRNCFYCFNPNQEGHAFFREHKRDVVTELNALKENSKSVRHIALTGGEPLLHKEDTLRFFQQARKDFPKVYTRLYTCGDHLDPNTLEALKEAGLDEIRISIRMEDLANGQRHTFDQIALAKGYIPQVMVEMPVLPGTLEEMKGVLKELARLQIFGINLLEFCFPYHNAGIYRERGYKIKARPYRVLYNYEYGGGLPVAGSEDICLELVAYALQENLDLGVHYCSLENKHSGQIYQQNSLRPLPKSMAFSPRDYFLKTAKVFGDDKEVVRKTLQQTGCTDWEENEEYNYLQFHPTCVRSLKKLDLQIGLSSNVFEIRDRERCVRELKVDIITPQSFRYSADI